MRKKCDQWDCFADVLRRLCMLKEGDRRGRSFKGESESQKCKRSADFPHFKTLSYNVSGKEQQWWCECVRWKKCTSIYSSFVMTFSSWSSWVLQRKNEKHCYLKRNNKRMEAEASAKVKSHHDEAFRWVRITFQSTLHLYTLLNLSADM